MFGQIVRANGHLAVQVRDARGGPGKAASCTSCRAPQPRHERVLQRRLVQPDFLDLQARLPRGGSAIASRHIGIVHQHIQPVAKALHIENLTAALRQRRKNFFGHRKIRHTQLHPPRAQFLAQFRGVPICGFRPDASARPGGIVPPRPDTASRAKSSARLRPGAPARPRTHAVRPGRHRGRLIEQQHPRFRHQRARQCELLLHPSAQLSGQP